MGKNVQFKSPALSFDTNAETLVYLTHNSRFNVENLTGLLELDAIESMVEMTSANLTLVTLKNVSSLNVDNLVSEKLIVDASDQSIIQIKNAKLNRTEFNLTGKSNVIINSL